MANKKGSRMAAAPKFTYQERVLNALSSEIKQHKKHSIHVATLNAQVKRHATTNNDKIGPSWKKYVGKAVASLREQGAISNVDSPGAISLTPLGKKAINTARRELSLENVDTLTLPEQEALWKRVVKIVSHPESRPSRRSYASPSTVRRDPERGPIGRMTKAQLLEKLKDLQMEHDRAKLRDTSPLTDIDDEEAAEETERLKTLIRDQNTQIQEIRRELDDARHQAATQYDGHSERFLTPEPLQQPTPRTDAIRLPNAAIRTAWNKQPTPAPSTPGSAAGASALDDSMMTGPGGVDDDFFSSPGLRIPLARQSSMLDQLKEHQFENEQLTTQLAMQSKDVAAKTIALASLQLEVENARTSYETRVKELETSQQAQAANLLQLEQKTLALSAEKEIQESKLLAAQLQIESNTTRISFLSSENSRIEAEMASKLQEATATSERTRASLLEQVSALSETKADLQSKLEAAEQELDQMFSSTEDLEVALHVAHTAAEELEAQIAQLKESLANLQSVLESRTSEFAAAEEGYRSSLHESNSVLDAANVQLASLQRDLEAKDVQLSSVSTQLADAVANGHTFEETIETLRSELAAAQIRQAELDGQRVAKEKELDDTLSRYDTQMSEVISQLEVTSAERDQTNTLFLAMQSANNALQVELTQTREVVTTTTQSLEATKSTLKRRESELEEVEGHAIALQQDVDMLYEGKARDDRTIDQLKSKCSQLASDAIRQFTQFNDQVASTESSPSPAKRARYSVA